MRAEGGDNRRGRLCDREDIIERYGRNKKRGGERKKKRKRQSQTVKEKNTVLVSCASTAEMMK